MTSVALPRQPVQYYSSGLRGRFQVDAHRAVAAPPAEGYADIDYEFDEAKYAARTESVLRAGGLEKELPSGFPASLSGQMVWSGADLSESDYVLQLSEVCKAEIMDALQHFLSLGLDGTEVGMATFPLPTLGPQLERAKQDVYDGRGFVIIRGLDVDLFSDEDLVIVYLGVTSYIAEKRGKQNQRGDMLVHVLNATEDDATANKSVEKPFHTDTVCDVLCLLTKACANVGGRSIMSSAWNVYNELAATRPDIIHTLLRPNWPFDTNGRDPPYYNRAILYYENQKMIWNFSRRLLTGAAPKDPRTLNIPGLTARQAEALDAVHAIARSHEVRTVMQKGDIRILNNMGILHRRESFEDDETSKRHLIRLWAHNEEYCWKLPVPLRLAWARVFEDDERETHWALSPVGLNGKILRQAVSCD
ncbi:related to TfdA family oxidoreductase [Cephalotrichum gorgonifer]|uniref:Related to TfdA family oxidoreductase n=1 Tax=Cephalotrichum gorgonifer TaxID=2041049 RepID=A0AAE8SR74_9PEZI|nr:related to TfdA family oxidoreductase [Cephalotrichum gorgonifer]